jgi:hypothetical protein
MHTGFVCKLLPKKYKLQLLHTKRKGNLCLDFSGERKLDWKSLGISGPDIAQLAWNYFFFSSFSAMLENLLVGACDHAFGNNCGSAICVIIMPLHKSELLSIFFRSIKILHLENILVVTSAGC